MVEREHIAKEKPEKLIIFDNRKVEGGVLVGLGFFAGYCVREATHDPKAGLAVGVLSIAIIYCILGIGKEVKQNNKIEIKEIKVNPEHPKEKQR